MAERPTRERQRQYRRYFQAELEMAALYKALADRANDGHRRQVLNELATWEVRHAAKWAEKLGIPIPQHPPTRLTLRHRILLLAADVVGLRRVLPFLLRGEADEIRAYSKDPEASELIPEERRHAGMLRKLFGEGRGSQVAAFEPRQIVSGSAVRAAVLGVNDGLVSNFSLVMGVAGASTNSDFILLAGVAGLLAGAFSMAAGEYVSVRSQRDLYENQIDIERAELEEFPGDEEQELTLIYEAKGLSKESAAQVAKHLMTNPQVALDIMVREKHGLDLDEVGSPWTAAGSSFVAFCLGAIVPILPFMLGGMGQVAVGTSAAASGLALVVVGGSLAYFSNRNVAWGSLRMLLAGGAAAAVTYGVGSLIGTTIT
ncbi:MAG: VIT1/CCC1 transporter family protein [Chloroflexi bacterium]|nr:VIT1/CCC1 transporter family protein [Chloroflexota bacterium]